ncbi:Pyrophosphate--fructose 6-phosphate 1-phosphotransferase subunit alpha 2 [Zea mays]|uniref:Pyrophosphate--fructose 6-phosphate 1-phosphotransferase subunit alpha 2 n=1 Tax=Zea mays TaxID=4577 RepID=A0A1D6KU00_MAIZE|nr:Pyrophosphate--fructose 6-phosphate 1-phosphotransferase subunit alpha 2 [Zea mays]ONM06062.1 Pyrophosphate--fructose 6-phosphate 1-phosphotransferase subunit alpha 2 [Zea mays]
MNIHLKEDTYKGKKFNAICHFLGYQARGALPSKFDCDYAYASPSPAHLVKNIDCCWFNTYMATVTNLKNPVNKWRCGATPISYYYFIRLMGRKASHVALECALQSHPNMVCFFLTYL